MCIGSGIYSHNSYPQIYNNFFKGSRQGALTCFSSSSVTMFWWNVVDSNYNNDVAGGGGILAYTSRLNISNNIFKQNRTISGGGAIILYDSTWNNQSNVIFGNLIINNSAGNYSLGTTFGGGAIHCKNNSPYIVNNTICNNYSIANGGGIACDLNSSPIIQNTIFYNNWANGNLENIFINDNLSKPKVNYCLMEGGLNSINTNGNLYVVNNSNIYDTIPNFVDYTNGNFELNPSSICIDKGEIKGLSFSGPVYDLAKKPRKVNSIIDIGAYEFQGSLPLKLLSFTAKKENNKALLHWQTANEVNVSHFNIQHSSNGKDFENMGKVNASCCAYSFVDANLPSLVGVVYYRLEMVDKDGSKTYSDVKTISYKIETINSVSIYPNPATTFVTIECQAAKEIVITNYLGKIIKQINNPSQHQTINTKQWSKGVYFVSIITNEGKTTKKLVVE